MKKEKDFTTGEAAKMCRISQQTIIRCFDSGQLKGFRVPGSRFRRIPRNELFAFMHRNNIPIPTDMHAAITVAIVTQDCATERFLKNVMTEASGFTLSFYDNTFDAGASMLEAAPDVIIIDCSNDAREAILVSRALRKKPALSNVAVFALTDGDVGTAEGIEAFKKPFDAELLFKRIKRVAGKDHEA